jgi:twitching motility two-component system response regulator PilH
MNGEPSKRKVLVIDDSTMLLHFVRDMLMEANYDVTTATTGTEGVAATKAERPELILLDYVLPDMRGDEVLRRLGEDSGMARIPVVYMSALGSDLRPEHGNVIGFLNKPFTSDLLIKTVETHMPQPLDEPEPAPEPNPPVNESPAAEENFAAEPAPLDLPPEAGSEFTPEPAALEPAAPADPQEWWTAPPTAPDWSQPRSFETGGAEDGDAAVLPAAEPDEADLPNESVTGGTFFCGDTRFFSLHWAIKTIGQSRLTGTLRSFWNRETVELLARNGEIVLATTRDSELYCSEAPITLVDVDQGRIAAAREQQRESGQPMFLILADEGAILRDPAAELVQHYGQKLFAQLWTAKRVRFVFENGALPEYAAAIPSDADVDNWTLATLRTLQYQDLGSQVEYEAAAIPAYTKDGFERVQNLRLTVAEAQFASQFNGARSIQQIAKNLRLDLKFARVTLFRFLALEIVECWPATTVAKPEKKGMLNRLSRAVGMGD